MAGTQRFFAVSLKKVKQQRNSQSIYFVTGGVFERDKEEDAEEARKKKPKNASFAVTGLQF